MRPGRQASIGGRGAPAGSSLPIEQAGRDAAAWREQWKKAVLETAGIASYLEEGDEYVEGIRRLDAERLSGLGA
jgi:hypothetical protein